MGWSEKDLCIKCDRGGKMLACSESRCPMVVHEKCMGCQPYFDDGRDFYCPYCLYKQTTAELHKALEVAMLKKRALSTFLDKELLNGDNLLPQPSDVLQSKYVHNSTDNNHDNDPLLVVVGHQTKYGPVVADGCKSSDEQVAIQGHRVVEDGEGTKAEHNSVVDDEKIDEYAEDPQEDGHPNEIPERERKAVKNDNHILAENDLEVEDIQDDCYLNEASERQKMIMRKATKLLAESEPDVDDKVLDDENHQEDGCASRLQERGNKKTKEKIKRDKKTRKNAKQVHTKNKLPNSDVEDRPEDGYLCDIPDRENKFRRISKRMLAEDEPEVSEEQLDKDVDNGHPSEIPDTEKKIRRKSKRKLAEDKLEVVDQVLVKDVEDCHLSEIPDKEEKKRRRSKRKLAEYELEVDDQRIDKVVEDGHLSGTPVSEKESRRKSKRRLAEDEPKDDDEQLDKDCNMREITENEENVRKKSIKVIFKRKVYEAGGAESGTISTRSKCILKKSETEDKPLNSDPKKGSSGSNYTTNAETNEPNSDVEDRPEADHLCDIPDRENKVRRISKEMLAEDEPEVSEEQLDKDVDNGQPSEIPDAEKKIRRKSKRKLAEDKPEVVDQVLDKDVVDCHLTDIPVKEEKKRRKSKRKLAEYEAEVEIDKVIEDGHLSGTPVSDKESRRKSKRRPAEDEPKDDDEQLDKYCNLREITENDENVRKKSIKVIIKRKVKEAGGAESCTVSTRSKCSLKKSETEDEPLNSDPRKGSSGSTYTTMNAETNEPNSDVDDFPEDAHLCDIPDRENKVRRISKQMLAEDEPEVSEELLDKDVDNGQPSEIPDAEKKIRRKSKRKVAEEKPEVVDQVLDKDVEDCHLSDIPDKEKKKRRKSKRKLAEYEAEVGDQQIDNDIDDGHLSGTPVSDKEIKRKSKCRPAEDEPEVDDEQLDKDCNLREITENEENVTKKSIKVKIKRKVNEAGGAESGTISTRSKCILKKNETEDEPLNSDPKKGSSESTYTTTNAETNEPIKLLAVENSTWQSPIPNGRRKKLMWSEEEEEMLKEGVHKFSTTANKNIPWRKILDFGRHVFDGTRTPVDLKDKWRTLWAK